MKRFLLDTNVFNLIVDRAINPTTLSRKGRLFVTHVQYDELRATHSEQRAQALLRVFETVEQELVPTAAAVWGVSVWGEAEWGDADGLYRTMLEALNSRNRCKANNARDVLIAVTAVKRALTLVTNDQDLAAVVRRHGAVQSFEEFMAGADIEPLEEAGHGSASEAWENGE